MSPTDYVICEHRLKNQITLFFLETLCLFGLNTQKGKIILRNRQNHEKSPSHISRFQLWRNFVWTTWSLAFEEEQNCFKYMKSEKF